MNLPHSINSDRSCAQCGHNGSVFLAHSRTTITNKKRGAIAGQNGNTKQGVKSEMT